ncbi:hypothetical protein Y88_1287 [Novosphingobium nitrogenifigens DSM 19370]|uniref:Uncharacterized protein n=1 Tax=Novosphingobium nitrogenifigens DSM 19370 TaxID=983920 RepID=F1Z801_9SPHN|nr:hypothetical protein Y88_1287 [Novosphingobium nitrogenifigens DSM 19370]
MVSRLRADAVRGARDMIAYRFCNFSLGRGRHRMRAGIAAGPHCRPPMGPVPNRAKRGSADGVPVERQGDIPSWPSGWANPAGRGHP